MFRRGLPRLMRNATSTHLAKSLGESGFRSLLSLPPQAPGVLSLEVAGEEVPQRAASTADANDPRTVRRLMIVVDRTVACAVDGSDELAEREGCILF